jgi:glutamate mutase epsilon subunit
MLPIELGNIAYEGEQFFDDAIKSIDAEKARIKREEEERKAQALQARIADINALGAIYHDGTYTLPYDESKSVTATQIATLSDTGFEELLDEMKEAFANEQTRLHEERLKEEAEAERLQGLQKQLEDIAGALTGAGKKNYGGKLRISYKSTFINLVTMKTPIKTAFTVILMARSFRR